MFLSFICDVVESEVGLKDELWLYEGLDTEEFELLCVENDVRDGEQLFGLDFFGWDVEELALNLTESSDDFFKPSKVEKYLKL